MDNLQLGCKNPDFLNLFALSIVALTPRFVNLKACFYSDFKLDETEVSIKQLISYITNEKIQRYSPGNDSYWFKMGVRRMRAYVPCLAPIEDKKDVKESPLLGF